MKIRHFPGVPTYCGSTELTNIDNPSVFFTFSDIGLQTVVCGPLITRGAVGKLRGWNEIKCMAWILKDIAFYFIIYNIL
jgi:hypothetical protein